MSHNTGPSALPLAEVERLRRLDAIITAARNEGSEDTELIEIVKAFLAQPQNGTKAKIAWLAGAGGVAVLVGAFLAVQVWELKSNDSAQQVEIANLKALVDQCLKRP